MTTAGGSVYSGPMGGFMQWMQMSKLNAETARMRRAIERQNQTVINQHAFSESAEERRREYQIAKYWYDRGFQDGQDYLRNYEGSHHVQELGENE